MPNKKADNTSHQGDKEIRQTTRSNKTTNINYDKT